jgi:hypothetical protein
MNSFCGCGENEMKQLKLFLLVAFLLSSCSFVATATSTSTPTQTLTPAPTATATQTPSPTPTIIPTPTPIGGGSGKLIFEYYKVAFEKSFPNLQGEVNIFTSNIDGTNPTPITNGLNGYNYIQSISPDGQMLLVASRSDYAAKGDLYLIHLNSLDLLPMRLARGLFAYGGQAIFLDNTRIVYVGQGPENYGFYVINIDGTNPLKIGAPTGKVWWITSSDKTRIYWGGIQSESLTDSSGAWYMSGDIQTLWWANLDGSGQGKLESNGQQIMGDQYSFSPDGTSIAWIPVQTEPGCSFGGYWSPWVRDGVYTQHSKNRTIIDIAYMRKCLLLHVASLSNMDNDTKIPLIPPYDPVKDAFFYHKEYYLTWWPDSSKILAYDGGGLSIYYAVTDHYLLSLYQIAPKDADPKLTLLKVLSNSSIVQPSGVGRMPYLPDSFNSFNFSPDGRQILFAKYSNDSNDSNDNQGSIINILNLDTMNYVNDFGSNITPDSLLTFTKVG